MFLSWSERLTRTGFDSPLRSCWSERLRRLEPEASSPRRWCGPGQRPEWRWRGRRYSCRHAAQSWHGPLSRPSPWWKRVRVSRQNFRSANILGYFRIYYSADGWMSLNIINCLIWGKSLRYKMYGRHRWFFRMGYYYWSS